MNRRRRRLERRLYRAVGNDFRDQGTHVSRREYARELANVIAKFRGAAHKRMILLLIIVAALGVITLVLLLFVMWPPPRQERLDELEVRRRQHPRTGRVDRVDEEEAS